jgi:hypothetical protein
MSINNPSWLNPSIYELMEQMNNRLDIHKNIYDAVSPSILGISSYDFAHQIAASIPNLANPLNFAMSGNVADMVRQTMMFIEDNRKPYEQFLSLSHNIVDFIPDIIKKSSPRLNGIVSNDIISLFANAYPKDLGHLTAFDLVTGTAFKGIFDEVSEVTEEDYKEAETLLKENEIVQHAMSAVIGMITTESPGIDSDQKYKNLEAIIFEKLPKEIKFGVRCVLVAVIWLFIQTIGKKEIEKAVYGDGTQKIIESIQISNGETNASIDSVKTLIKVNTIPETHSFSLGTISDCNLYQKNSSKSKVIRHLKKGESVIVIQEYRKWTYVEITGSAEQDAVKGFILKSQLDSD